jgi:16S rRNA (guanine527-N7)-methyltransferase
MNEQDQSRKAQIACACRFLNLTFNDDKLEQWLHYLALLHKWNQAYNLTGIKSIDKMLPYHLYDSLAVAPFIKPGQTLDIGTGAGIPGVPLAILMPEYTFYLLDRNHKKIRFIKHALRALKLKNVKTFQCSVEHYQPDTSIDNVITRAFASLKTFHHSAYPFITASGQLLAMKAKITAEEIHQLKQATDMQMKIETINVPYLNAKRTLVSLNH